MNENTKMGEPSLEALNVLRLAAAPMNAGAVFNRCKAFETASDAAKTLSTLYKNGHVGRIKGDLGRYAYSLNPAFGEWATKETKAESPALPAAPIAPDTDKLARANADLATENETLRRARDELAAQVCLQQDAIARLQEACKAAEAEVINKESSVINSLSDDAVKSCFTGYVLRTPSKPMLFFSKEESAKKSALVLARSSSPVEVFAMVKLGRAVRGSQWVEA